MVIVQFIQEYFYTLLIVLFLVLLFKGRILSKIYGIQSISVQDAFELFKKPAKSLFLDVRTSWEIDQEARIKASLAIPLSDLSARMDEVKAKSGNRKVVVVCRSGNRAISAAVKLKKAGITDVEVLSGGVYAWQRADYPVTRPKKTIKRTYG